MLNWTIGRLGGLTLGCIQNRRLLLHFSGLSFPCGIRRGFMVTLMLNSPNSWNWPQRQTRLGHGLSPLFSSFSYREDVGQGYVVTKKLYSKLNS